MSNRVIVDASVAVKWLVEEADTPVARALAASWVNAGVTPTAPYLMPAEVANALHRRVVDGHLSLGTASELIETLLVSGLELLETRALHSRAIELASLFDQGAVYDVHYLALAEALECELWTADRRFHRAVGTTSDRVRWIGEAAGAGAP